MRDYTINKEQIKKIWYNEFKPYSKYELDLLKKLFAKGDSVILISSALKRQPRSLFFKLKKLGLNPKDSIEEINEHQEKKLKDLEEIIASFKIGGKAEIQLPSKITPQAKKLYIELIKNNVDCCLEYWDGKKHIDLAILQANLFIEIDGVQHITISDELARDLVRDYYNAINGFFTLHIPNDWIEKYLDDIVKSICIIIRILRDDSFLSDWLDKNPSI